MAVILRASWNGHPAGSRLSLSSYDEAALVRGAAADFPGSKPETAFQASSEAEALTEAEAIAQAEAEVAKAVAEAEPAKAKTKPAAAPVKKG